MKLFVRSIVIGSAEGTAEHGSTRTARVWISGGEMALALHQDEDPHAALLLLGPGAVFVVLRDAASSAGRVDASVVKVAMGFFG